MTPKYLIDVSVYPGVQDNKPGNVSPNIFATGDIVTVADRSLGETIQVEVTAIEGEQVKGIIVTAPVGYPYQAGLEVAFNPYV
jgi:hypothetical protein